MGERSAGCGEGILLTRARTGALPPGLQNKGPNNTRPKQINNLLKFILIKISSINKLKNFIVSKSTK